MNFQSTGKNTGFRLARGSALESVEKTSTIGIRATAAIAAARSEEYNTCRDGVPVKYSEVIRGRIGRITRMVRLSDAWVRILE